MICPMRLETRIGGSTRATRPRPRPCKIRTAWLELTGQVRARSNASGPRQINSRIIHFRTSTPGIFRSREPDPRCERANGDRMSAGGWMWYWRALCPFTAGLPCLCFYGSLIELVRIWPPFLQISVICKGPLGLITFWPPPLTYRFLSTGSPQGS